MAALRAAVALAVVVVGGDVCSEAGRCLDAGEAWIAEPRSGSIVRGGVVEVEIGLRVGSATTGATSGCLTVSRIVDGAPVAGDERWPSTECSDVSLPSSAAGETEPLVAKLALELRPAGWYKLELVLRGGPASASEGPTISQFAVAIFVAGAAAAAAEEPADGARRLLGLAWDWGGGIGWGVAGLHIALALCAGGSPALPVPLGAVHGYEVTPEQRAALGPSVAAAAAARKVGERGKNASKAPLDFPVVHALGRWGVNGSLGSMDEELWSAERNVGILFAESVDWSAADLEALRRFDFLLVGSTWCGRGLADAAAALEAASGRAQAPLPPLVPFMQGVDGALFKAPSAVARPAGARFRVFSGGKLEWRKGQDVVVAAFKRFAAAHPEARAELLVNWANPWRVTMLTIENASHTRGAPAPTRQQDLEATTATPLPKTDADHQAENAKLLDWLEDNGVDRNDVVALPPVHHRHVPGVLRSADAAIFPNRAEGGTNLVAMETVAMGVPTILSYNTGQVDLVDFLDGRAGCWPLYNQTLSPWARESTKVSGLESDPAEAARALEDIYLHRGAARRRALSGARRMRGPRRRVPISPPRALTPRPSRLGLAQRRPRPHGRRLPQPRAAASIGRGTAARATQSPNGQP